MAAIATLLMLMLTSSYIRAGHAGDTWPWVAQAKDMPSSEFRLQLQPLLAVVSNTYSYPNLTAVADWRLCQLTPLNSDVEGQRGLCYVSSSTRRVALALRGAVTDADDCAIDALLCGLEYQSLPAKCRAFSASTLDYIGQTARYAWRAMEVYPSFSVALVGHSLGAGVAVMASAKIASDGGPNIPVVGFSTPGTAYGLSVLDLMGVEPVVSVVNKFDPLIQAGRDYWVGDVCEYSGTDDCLECIASGNSSVSAICSTSSSSSSSSFSSFSKRIKELPTGICGLCVLETHGLNVIAKLIREDAPHTWITTASSLSSHLSFANQ